MGGEGSEGRDTPLILPLIESPFCPFPPQTAQRPHLPQGPSPRGMGTLPLRAPTTPGPLLGCSPRGLPEALPPCPLHTPLLSYLALHLPSSGCMLAHSVVSNSL